MKTVPTVREMLEARARLTEAKVALDQCNVVCEVHSAVDPLDVAFAEGVGVARMRARPEPHWTQFVKLFGEIDGARARFDAGRASIVP